MSGLGPAGPNHGGFSLSQAGLRRNNAFPPPHASQANKQPPAPLSASPYQPQAYQTQPPQGAYPSHMFGTPSVNNAVPNGPGSRGANPHLPNALNIRGQQRASVSTRGQMQQQPNAPDMLYASSMGQGVQQHDSMMTHQSQQQRQQHPHHHQPQQHPHQQTPHQLPAQLGHQSAQQHQTHQSHQQHPGHQGHSVHSQHTQHQSQLSHHQQQPQQQHPQQHAQHHQHQQSPQQPPPLQQHPQHAQSQSSQLNQQGTQGHQLHPSHSGLSGRQSQQQPQHHHSQQQQQQQQSTPQSTPRQPQQQHSQQAQQAQSHGSQRQQHQTQQLSRSQSQSHHSSQPHAQQMQQAKSQQTQQAQQAQQAQQPQQVQNAQKQAETPSQQVSNQADEVMEVDSNGDVTHDAGGLDPKLLNDPNYIPTQPMGEMMSAPPEGGSYPTLEAIQKAVLRYCTSVGYAIVIGRSKKTVPGLKKVLFVCDRAGRPPSKMGGELRKRKTSSRKCDCPFGFFAIEQRTQWTIRYRPNQEHLHHNHGPSESPSIHPAARKLDSKIVAAVKQLKDNGRGVSETLQILQTENPECHILARDIYNARAAITRNPQKISTALAENRPSIYHKPPPTSEDRIKSDLRKELMKVREDMKELGEAKQKEIDMLNAKIVEKDALIHRFEMFIDICNQRVMIQRERLDGPAVSGNSTAT